MAFAGDFSRENLISLLTAADSTELMESMKIEEGKVVSMDYTLKNDEGAVIDQSKSDEPFAYLHGHRNIVPGLESALEGKSAGESVAVRLEPKDGYGEVDSSLVQKVPMEAFQGIEKVEVGMHFQAGTPQGPMTVQVAKVEGDEVTVDANHPLAGKALNFEVAVKDVRQGTEEEIEHGHIHRGGEGCCGGNGGGSCGCS